MKKLNILLSLAFVALTACDVHEWPEAVPGGDPDPEIPVTTAEVNLNLNFATKMTKWEHSYAGASSGVIENPVSNPESYDNKVDEGTMRYLVRFYPQSSSGSDYVEYSFVRSIGARDSYDYSVKLTLPVGDYEALVWADLSDKEGDAGFYDTSSFPSISVENADANNDLRDAFSGSSTFSASADDSDSAKTVNIDMKRPMSKFEFVAQGLDKFLSVANARAAGTYKVTIQYTPYVPNTFNVRTGNVGSTDGHSFTSTLDYNGEQQASLGFDYVITRNSVNESDVPSVDVQIILSDSESKVVAKSQPINVPVKRDHHTVITGNLLSPSSGGNGGVGIDPDFDDEFNIIY